MRQKAFTLIELLVVIAIVGILSSVVYTNISGVREKARISAGTRFDSSTLHSIGDQLVGEWTFDVSPIGNQTIDTSGFGNTGTVTGATYATTSGYNNKGTYYLAGGQYIDVGSSLSFVPEKITVSAWIKINDNASSVRYAIAGNARDCCTANLSGWDFYYHGSSGLRAIIWNNATSRSLQASPALIYTPGVWYHSVFTYDGNEFVLYSNGNQVAKTTWGPTLSIGSPPTFVDTYIGRSPGASWTLAGYIDDVRIYSGTLSSSDIQKLYAEGKDLHKLTNI